MKDSHNFLKEKGVKSIGEPYASYIIEKWLEEFIEYKLERKSNKLTILVQGYLGMEPKDKSCKGWGEMQDKLVNEISNLLKK